MKYKFTLPFTVNRTHPFVLQGIICSTLVREVGLKSRKGLHVYFVQLYFSYGSTNCRLDLGY